MPGEIVLYAAITCGIVYLGFVNGSPSRIRTTLKACPLGLLALFAWLSGGSALLVAALILSAFGDACLARPDERRFLYGLSSFLLAHVAYGVLFASTGNPALLTGEPWRMVVAVFILVASVIMLARLWKPVGAMAPAVSLYIVVILCMAVLSLTCAPILVSVGAILFVTSDAALATERFTPPAHPGMRRALRLYVWISYFVAQLLLCLALLGL